MNISSKLKKILEENRDLINNNEFKQLYDNIPDPLTISQLTQLLYTSGIDPLKYMDKIPFYFFYLIKVPENFVIPANIREITPDAFNAAQVESMYIPESVSMIKSAAFFSSDLRSISISENTNLYPNALAGMRRLQNIKIRSNKSWDEIGGGLTKSAFLDNVGASSNVKIWIEREG